MLFDTLRSKLIVLLTVVLLTGGAGTAYWYRGVELARAQAKTAVEDVANKVLTNTVKTDVAVAVVNNNVNTDLVKNVIKANGVHDVISSKTNATIAAIKKSYSSLSGLKTTKQTIDERDAISNAIISGIWSQYCTIEPTLPTCILTK